MKTKHIFWGMFFISFGLIFLLNNIGKLQFVWSDIWKFWPVVFIVLVISFFSSNSIIKGFLTALTAIIVAFILFAFGKVTLGFANDNISFDGHSINVVSDSNYSKAHYFEPYKTYYKNATFNFEAGAGSFALKDTTQKLIYVTTAGVHNNYVLTQFENRNNVSVELKMKRKQSSFFNGKLKNYVDIKLNNNPVWDMNFKVGAASINFDLTLFKIENISIKMGAASLKLKLGNKNNKTVLNLEGGVSSVEISVPKSAGCQIRVNAALSSKHFEDFTKIDSGLYQTDNFDKSVNKIILNLNTGVSSITVNRYDD